MDLFKYKASVKELETCPTVSKLEELLRMYHRNTAKVFLQYDSENYRVQSSILHYKLYTLALNLFKERSKKILPDFLYDNHTKAQIELVENILDLSKRNNPRNYNIGIDFKDYTPTYKDIIDWFEYDNLLHMPYSEVFTINLNTIIGSNPIHFKIRFNHALSSFDSHSTTLSRPQQMLLYAIRYKLVNFPNKAQTVWDMFIKDYTAKASPLDMEELTKQVLQLKQQIKALNAFPRKTNEQ